MELGYLISPVVQIVDHDGKPIVGAKIYVYNANTTVLVDTYNDFEGHLNTNPVLTDTLGNCTIIADNSKVYDIIVNDENDNLLFGKKNITISSGVDPSSSLVFESGYGITIERTGNTVSIAVDTDLIATQDDLATKQDKLYAGDNIEIDSQNKINVVQRKTLSVISPLKMDLTNDKATLYIKGGYTPTTLSAGTDLTIIDNVVSVDTDGTISGNYNFIGGHGTSIVGDSNVVFGYINSVNTGSRNAVFGGGNVASGYSNIVAGYNCNGIGAGNSVFGLQTNANGSHNLVAGNYISITGNGNGALGSYINVSSCNETMVFGKSSTADRLDNSIVFGYNNNIQTSRTNNNAVCNVVGTENNVSGDNVFVYGSDNNISGTSNYVVGNHNNVASYNGTQACVAVGDYNKVSQYNSFAFGNKLSANNEEILIGLGPSSTSLEFSGTYLKITTAGLFKVVNGVETQL